MAVLQALRRSPTALRRVPLLVVPTLVLFVFQFPQLLLQSTNPLLASVVSLGASLLMLVLLPFLQAGLIGMADEALDGDSSLQAFIAYGKANYGQVLIAYLLVLIVNSVLGGILFAVGIGAVLSGVFELSTLALGVLGLIALVVALAYVVFAFFIQFYGQAIVLEDYSGIDGLKRSYSVVRSNLRAALGYLLLGLVFGGGVGLLFGGLSILTTPEAARMYGLPVLSISGIAAVGVVLTVVGAVFSTFFVVYSVAFYRIITSADTRSPPTQSV